MDDLTGAVIEVQSKAEKDYYTSAQKRYMSENTFTVSSDLRALDRLIFFETIMFRWQSWLGSGKDYEGFLSPGMEEQIRKSMKETAPIIAQIQNDLGLTKSQRDKDAFESVGAYIVKLQNAAKAHGVRREKQLTKSIDLTKQLFAMVGAYQRSDEHERKKLGFEKPEDIILWIEEYMKPEFDAVDEHFRANVQKFWVGQL